jgi:hypothetical protein
VEVQLTWKWVVALRFVRFIPSTLWTCARAVYFLFSKMSRPTLGSIDPPVQWVHSQGPIGRGVKLTSHLHLLPRWRMSGASSARFEGLTAMLLRMQVVWNVTRGQRFPRRLCREQTVQLKWIRRFSWTFCTLSWRLHDHSKRHEHLRTSTSHLKRPEC